MARDASDVLLIILAASSAWRYCDLWHAMRPRESLSKRDQSAGP